jgi:hypothetical protein
MEGLLVIDLIRGTMLAAIANRRTGTFSWPDDYCCSEKWYYWVHVTWVDDWNREGRVTECIEFLLKWLDSDANIQRALDKAIEWKAKWGTDT